MSQLPVLKKLRLFVSANIVIIAFLFSNHGFSNTAKDPLIIFLHGAHLTAKSWSLVTNQLENKGIKSLPIDLPGRNDQLSLETVTLDSSAEYLCTTLKGIKQELVFVVHSQAGAILNHSQSICPTHQIKSIVYLASVFPTGGERPFDRLSKLDEENYFKGVSFDEKNSAMVISNQLEFLNTFTSLNKTEQPEGISTYAVDEPARIGDGIVKYNKESLDSVKKYYIFTSKDRIISPDSQTAIAEHMKPDGTYKLDTGHIPMLTHPTEVTRILISLLGK